MNKYTIISPPAVLPIDFAYVNQNLGGVLDPAVDTNLVDNLIAVATDYIQLYLSRSLITTGWRLKMDCFPSNNDMSCCGGVDSVIQIRRSPLQSITSIDYIDIDSNTQTIPANDYYIEDLEFYSNIVLDSDNGWPQSKCRKQAVTIDFVAGYGDAGSDVPNPIRQAIAMMVANLIQQKGDCTSTNCSACLSSEQWMLLKPYKVLKFGFCDG